MIKIHNVDQQSEEWFELKKKYPLSASHADAIGTGGVGLETICYKAVSELYSANPIVKENFSNDQTSRGNEFEPLAAEIYEMETETKLGLVGFVTNDEISQYGGASPDREVLDSDGLVEIKAFEDHKHLKMINDFKKTGKFEIEKGYIWQMNQQMLFTGKKWVDFAAFNPNFKQSLLIQRVYPDPVMQEKLRIGLKKGDNLINETINNIK